ncbi:hypothetical protein DM01DRAFT_1381364 [Hesseltinella vesiculosa]|uniref:Uncharacterized protein n=1 Tax=Hesseltinella vesiculosa TaxID=101127 RepID=A0A1X2GPL1_9FUNG|nr:hypothetical protein DM01DRAFT_1381364 [Hesseltinella vesiculosa]
MDGPQSTSFPTPSSQSSDTSSSTAAVDDELQEKGIFDKVSEKPGSSQDPSVTPNADHPCGDVEDEETDEILSDKESIFGRKKRRRLMIRRIAYILIMNGAIPIGLYYILKSHIPPVWALVISSAPTLLSVIVQAIFMRRVDSIGIAVIFGFILSVILASANRDPKLLLLRESFVTAGVGVVCALTLIPVRIRSFQLKPVLFYLARDVIPLRPVTFHEAEQREPQSRINFYWENSAYMRRHVRILTAVDILILELEFGLKLFYIFRFDLDTVVILSNSTLSIIGILVSLFTFWYILVIRRRLRKDEPAMLAAANAIK